MTVKYVICFLHNYNQITVVLVFSVLNPIARQEELMGIRGELQEPEFDLSG